MDFIEYNPICKRINGVAVFKVKILPVNRTATVPELHKLFNDALEFNCCFDTGASRSFVNQKTVEQLDLQREGNITMFSSGGKNQTQRTVIDVKLSDDIILRDLMVGISNSAIDILLGMDIISQGDFHLHPFGNSFLITWRIPPTYK